MKKIGGRTGEMIASMAFTLFGNIVSCAFLMERSVVGVIGTLVIVALSIVYVIIDYMDIPEWLKFTVKVLLTATIIGVTAMCAPVQVVEETVEKVEERFVDKLSRRVIMLVAGLIVGLGAGIVLEAIGFLIDFFWR